MNQIKRKIELCDNFINCLNDLKASGKFTGQKLHNINEMINEYEDIRRDYERQLNGDRMTDTQFRKAICNARIKSMIEIKLKYKLTKYQLEMLETEIDDCEQLIAIYEAREKENDN